jgi:hypothetical protein
VASTSPVVITSRGLAEYRAMFALQDADLAGRVLDCCSGAASLVAHVHGRGGQAVGCDPLYALGPAELGTRVARDAGAARDLVDSNPGRFSWRWYGSPQARDRMRADAAEEFLADLAVNPGHYLAGALPRLPFAGQSFDLALCSYLLFSWADRLDEGWHRAALTELARVAREVRVYPLVTAGKGEQVPFLDHLVETLRADGYAVTMRTAEYEFQLGAGQMLIIRRQP